MLSDEFETVSTRTVTLSLALRRDRATRREREPDVHHHRPADELRAGLEVPERIALGHASRLCEGAGLVEPGLL